MKIILDYLKQPSTWKGIVSIFAATGIVTLTQTSQDAIVEVALLVVAAIAGVIGAVDVIKDEIKK